MKRIQMLVHSSDPVQKKAEPAEPRIEMGTKL